MPVYFLSF